MSNLPKNTDNSIQPSRSEEIQPEVNYREMAISDHEEDQDYDRLMRSILESEKPLEYKVARCRLLLNTFQQGIRDFERMRDERKTNTTKLV